MNEAPGRALVAAAIAFTIALFVFGSAVVRAVGTETVTPVAVPGSHDIASDASTAESMSTEALMLAVDNDPFRPDRQRPAERYRLPGDVAPVEPEPPMPEPLPIFLLHGTIVDPVPGRSVALIQYGEAGTPALLPVGGVIGGYRISEVTPEAATVTNGEREIWLRVPGPLQTVAAQPEPQQRGRTNARQREAPASPTATQQEQQRQRVMQIMEQLERARQSGAPPQVLQALELTLQGVMRGSGDNIRIMTREATPRRIVPDTMSTDAPGAPGLR